MKRILVLLSILALSGFLPAKAEERGGGGEMTHESMPAAAPARQPVVINMSRPAPRTNNTHFQPAQKVGNTPSSYSHVQWRSNPQPQQPPSSPQSRVHYVPATHTFAQRANAATFASPGMRAANVVHHHPYTAGYVRKKLQKMGVKIEPSYITDRSQIMNTDAIHSTIRLPKNGPDHQPLSATPVSYRHFNDDVVRNHMALVNSPGELARINGFNAAETRSDHFYWHQENGFNYCHYIDPYGYHWYGWYVGDQSFWTRYFGDRWWWYDGDNGRWCFWNEGFWWWQDPDHIGDLYCYNNDAYIPCNSAQDQIVVTAPDTANVKTYQSPDGTRQVKLVNDTQDAFLYDTANPPSFNPVYLATGVADVQFSNPQNGRPMEILLKMNDGSFDVYDGEGNAYSPGSGGFDAEQATQEGQPQAEAPPADSGAPADNGAPAGNPGTTTN